MKLQVLNGYTSQVLPQMNGATSRVLPLNGADMYDGQCSPEMYQRFLMLKAMGHPDAMNGLNGFFKKLRNRLKAGKERRVQRRRDRRARREERRELRMDRRRARTEAIQKGEGFFQNVGGAIADIGQAKKAAVSQAMADQGLPYDDALSFTRVAEEADDDEPTWLEANWMYVAGGVAIAGLGIYLATRNKPKRRKR